MVNGFIQQLRAMGIEEGDTVLVHSSMKAIGTDLSPLAIIEILQQAVGTSGTLLLPTFTYMNVDANQPVYNSKTTKPCIGLLPSVFVNCQDVIRSIHPTHSVCAWGKNARVITADHEIDITPVGANSPYMKLLEYDGKILFIGDILNACTFMHAVEEIVGTDYTLQKEKIKYIVDGKERFMYRHDFDGWRQEYWKITNILSEQELIRGRFGNAICYTVKAEDLLEKGSQKLKEEPHYFVTDISKSM